MGLQEGCKRNEEALHRDAIAGPPVPKYPSATSLESHSHDSK